MSQAQRDRVMTRFRSSGLEFLVATDVAARGIDVDNKSSLTTTCPGTKKITCTGSVEPDALADPDGRSP